MRVGSRARFFPSIVKLTQMLPATAANRAGPGARSRPQALARPVRTEPGVRLCALVGERIRHPGLAFHRRRNRSAGAVHEPHRRCPAGRRYPPARRGRGRRQTRAGGDRRARSGRVRPMRGLPQPLPPCAQPDRHAAADPHLHERPACGLAYRPEGPPMRPAPLLGTALAVLSLGVGAAIEAPLRLVYNGSASAPPGWLLPDRFRDVFEGRLRAGARAGMGSRTGCRTWISARRRAPHQAGRGSRRRPDLPPRRLRSHQRHARRGRAARRFRRPAAPQLAGLRDPDSGRLFLLQDHPRSFDGRYLGPVDRASIIGRATPLRLQRRKRAQFHPAQSGECTGTTSKQRRAR